MVFRLKNSSYLVPAWVQNRKTTFGGVIVTAWFKKEDPAVDRVLVTAWVQKQKTLP